MERQGADVFLLSYLKAGHRGEFNAGSKWGEFFEMLKNDPGIESILVEMIKQKGRPDFVRLFYISTTKKSGRSRKTEQRSSEIFMNTLSLKSDEKVPDYTVRYLNEYFLSKHLPYSA